MMARLGSRPTFLGLANGAGMWLWVWLLMRRLQGVVDVGLLLLMMRMLQGLVVVRVLLGNPQWT